MDSHGERGTSSLNTSEDADSSGLLEQSRFKAISLSWPLDFPEGQATATHSEQSEIAP